MKKHAFLLSFLISFSWVYAQNEVVEVTPGDKEVVAQELEKESESGQHDRKTKRMLKKVAQFFKESSQKVSVEVKKLDDCSNCEGKSKAAVISRNIGMKVGKGAAWLTTITSKPFAHVAGFITGFLEKKEKNQDMVALYKFLLNHSEEFDKLYLEAGNLEEMAELALMKIEEIMQKKTRIILGDALKQLGVNRELPEDLADFELTESEIASIDLTKVNADLINNHSEYAELRPIVGDVKNEEIMDLITVGYFDQEIGFENYKAALPKIHEGVVTVAGQIFAPKIALGIISKSLGGLYALPVVAADIGTGISAAVCLSEPTKSKIENDKDLKEFCSFVVNRSAYELLKSRSKGYVAGKKFRVKIEEKIQKQKQRRAERLAKKKAKQSGSPSVTEV